MDERSEGRPSARARRAARRWGPGAPRRSSSGRSLGRARLAAGAGAGARPRRRPEVAGGGRRRSGDRPELPVPLRRMTMADRLDGALRILKLAPGPVLALTAAAVAPFEVLAAPSRSTARTTRGAHLPRRPAHGAPHRRHRRRCSPARCSSSSSTPSPSRSSPPAWPRWSAAGTSGAPGADRRRAAHRRRPPARARRRHDARPPRRGVFGLVLFLPALIPMVWLAVVAPVIGAEGPGRSRPCGARSG